MTEFEKLLVSARYQPTTVGNMIADPNGGYCSYHAVEAAVKEVIRLHEENERLKANPPQPLSPWQPIATAPKDGTHVLLSYSGRITYGYWLVLEVGKLVGYCGGVCRCPEYDEAPDPYWYSDDGGFTEEHPPTHWMPLPEPAP